jgi:hypothetical protein
MPDDYRLGKKFFPVAEVCHDMEKGMGQITAFSKK